VTEPAAWPRPLRTPTMPTASPYCTATKPASTPSTSAVSATCNSSAPRWRQTNLVPFPNSRRPPRNPLPSPFPPRTPSPIPWRPSPWCCSR
jgi:hypothetical protein